MQYSWRTLVNMPREKGLTPERKGDAFDKTCNRSEQSHEKIFPFHVRVPGISKRFRVFGYQHQETFFVTQIDKNHTQHKRK